MAHALRPSGSSQRIVGDLRSVKWSTRREERYRILSSHRAGMPAEQSPSTQPEPTEEPGKNAWSLGEVQVFDIIQEDGDQDKAPSKLLTPDPETILCNSMKMLREKLSVSGEGVGVEHREREDDYVYDLYYQETVAAGWIQDILSVRPYSDEGELVVNEEVYEDENEEGNWRNDYPDEDGSDREERFGGSWEVHSYSRRSWDQYQGEVMQELDDDDNGDKDDSD